MDIHDSILDLVGDTPMLYLDALRPEGGARIAAKLEMFNPGFSVKDRIGINLIKAGEEQGLLKPGGTIVEPTSGNTGLGLAMAASIMGYKMVCTLPDKVPEAKRDLLRAYGAEVIVCPTNVEADDPESYYKVAERLRDEGAYLPYQYYNQANPESHLETTGPEIWTQTDGKITHFVAGVGTGGTISGIGRYLHQQNKDVRIVGVDTEGSIYEHYHKHGELPPADQIHQYEIQGIGEDFLPESVWMDEIDDVVTISDADAFAMQARLVRRCAVFSGSSAGAAVAGAVRVAVDADP
ncbi:MAG TPA: cysteine synthase family protein, partial [Desulfurivibrionaceae bacterium]|nr:cysteine synthase family protein [Desulfurivibrionaceae bacterium]